MLEALSQLARSAAFRVMALFVALFVVAAVLASTALIVRTNEDMGATVLRMLADERDVLAALARAGGPTALREAVDARSRAGAPSLYHLADAEGRRIAGNLTRLPPELGRGNTGALFQYAAGGVLGDAERLAAGLSVDLPDGTRLAIARDIEDQRALADRLRRAFLWGIATLAMAGLVGGLVASRAILRRLETANRTARSIMAGDLTRRVPNTGAGDEFDDLADNLNRMLERIEELMAGLRQVSDNIAHDLKTPLTRLRSRAEAALRDERGGAAWQEGLERTIEDADELIKTFNAMLLVARLEAGAIEDSLVAFDLAEVVADVAELYEPVAEEAGLSLAVDISARPRVIANREMIGQALANLVDNAIKYSAGATTAPGPAVSLALGRDGQAITIRVADRGPGIAPADRERALRRFVRLEASRTRPGTGLGLSLVAAVARLHGGTLSLGDNHPGLVVTLTLPASCLAGPEAQAPRREIVQQGSEA